MNLNMKFSESDFVSITMMDSGSRIVISVYLIFEYDSRQIPGKFMRELLWRRFDPRKKKCSTDASEWSSRLHNHILSGLMI
jgi:hypothetical protein